MENMVLSGTSESSKVKFVKTNFKSDFVRVLKKNLIVVFIFCPQSMYTCSNKVLCGELQIAHFGEYN